MSYNYNPLNIKGIKQGTKVLLRNGAIREVIVHKNMIFIGLYKYNEEGRAPSIMYDLTKYDVIGIVDEYPIPLNLRKYDLRLGQYAIDSRGEVYRYEGQTPYKEYKFRRVVGDLLYVTRVDGSAFSADAQLVQVFSELKPIERVDVSNLKVGDKVRLRNRQVHKVQEADNTEQPVKVDGLWYCKNGVCNIDFESVENPRDIVEILPKEIKRVDVSNLKAGDKVRLRGGRVATVVEVDDSDDTLCLIDSQHILSTFWYRHNGVRIIDANCVENPRDIVEILTTPAPNITETYKRLITRLIESHDEDDLITVNAADLKALIQATDTKAKDAVTSLLFNVFCRGGIVSLPLHYLKKLVNS